jgi:holo-[acyl-carrier protein] synthase
MASSAELRVGIDLVEVDAVRESIRVHQDRYLRRIYTERELADSRGRPESLAARFAAKEAALKVLRHEDEPVPWSAIEVMREPGGRTALRLSGRAAELAGGIDQIAVSLTHEGPFASAVVVAR